MSTARNSGNRRAGAGNAARRANSDEIIKSARRRARAADSRRRALLGDDGGRPATDGDLALDTFAEPIEIAEPAPSRPDAMPGRQRRAAEPKTASTRSTVSKKSAPPEPVATARAPFVLSILGLIAAGILGLLFLNTAINSNAFQLQDLRNKQAQMDASEQGLREDLAGLNAPGNLRAAAEKMGLKQAGKVTYVRPDGKEVKHPKPTGN